MQLQQIQQKIIQLLEKELSPRLFYHDVRHTLDVFAVTEELCKIEGVSENDTFLLKIAALFHDSGFIISRYDHEMNSCKIARDLLPDFGLSEEQIHIICGMIMATKIPQTPKTELEKIICDADLDYLGRPDYTLIANQLFLELKSYDVIQDESAWKRLQINFLKSHHYFTKTNLERRTAMKEKQLQKIMSTHE